MRRAMIRVFLVTAIVSMAIACGRHQAAPASPTSATPGTSDAVADGTTLKASAPALQAPLNGVQVAPFQQVTLTLANSTTPFATNAALSYRFEFTNAAGTVVENAVVAGGSGTTSRLVAPALLQDGALYRWRARAEFQDAFGPWSALASFLAPINDGFIRSDALYDPLINGKTVGEIHGNVTFIPNVGLRINDNTSWVSYQLPQTLTPASSRS